MLRLGASEKAVTELVALGEHVVGLCLGAAGHQLRPEDLQVDMREIAGDSEVEIHAEIAAWTMSHLGFEGIPRYWWILRGQPEFRAANWRVHRLVLGEGELEARTKAHVALGVAALKGSAFWVEYFTQYGRAKLGVTDDERSDALAVAAHSASYNTVSHGMQLKADRLEFRASDFHETGEDRPDR